MRGRPGLAVALLRYVVLTLPVAWIGMRASAAIGYPEIYGLVVGLLVAGGITSAVFLVWLLATLRTAAAAKPVGAPGPADAPAG